MIVDYRNNVWKLNPPRRYVGRHRHVAGDLREHPHRGTRRDVTSAADLKVASFNVLNYFTRSATGHRRLHALQRPHRRRRSRSTAPGCDPRGAWDAGDLARQQDKIVAAINALDADVVGLLEIENSAASTATPDEALGDPGRRR